MIGVEQEQHYGIRAPGAEGGHLDDADADKTGVCDNVASCGRSVADNIHPCATRPSRHGSRAAIRSISCVQVPGEGTRVLPFNCPQPDE